MTTDTTGAPDVAVVVQREGHLGRLTLNRARTLNALTVPLIRSVHAALRDWRDDPDVATVLIEGDGRAFCAGGDIHAVHASAVDGTSGAADLWREQYLLNADIVSYPKPVVTLLDGITMGGGVGLGCHARHRVATENTLLAMPEVSIGLAPDVGGLLLLSRAPGEAGTHLALTAGRIGPEDALWCGLADHYVPSEHTDALITELAARPADEAIAMVAENAETLDPAPLAGSRPWIDACYDGDEVRAIVAKLRARPEREAHAAAERLVAMSPLATVVCLRALRSAATLDDELAVFAQDYRVTLRFLDAHDLAAGIRSAVITKDRSPVWSPAKLEDITPPMVDRHFEGLGDRELPIPTGRVPR